MTDTQMFAFESDFVATLRCVPMAVRLKLDLCGIKLSLRQWSRFTRDDRYALLVRPCATGPESEAYRDALTALIAFRTGDVAKALAEAPCKQWDDPHRVPQAVIDYARQVGLEAPTLCRWAALSRLQRFVLIKLTRDKHDNVNFAPAMREFGLGAAAFARDARQTPTAAGVVHRTGEIEAAMSFWMATDVRG